MSSTTIKFINHASVLVKSENTSLLSDPWYYGDSFHKGWNLLVQQSKEEISLILDEVTHIWISHEHPDHFSVKFFIDFKEKITAQKINILFQRTNDKRVFNFLKQLKLDVTEIDFNKDHALGPNYKVKCIKDGFYDSALLISTRDKKILNLNDCEIRNIKRAEQIRKITGSCDILLSQFSYAAWKGGKDNILWRKKAANEKIQSLNVQIRVFKPKVLIPFASYIYFSNTRNKYLNDCVNTPNQLLEELKENNVHLNVMKPFDEFDGTIDKNQIFEAMKYWDFHFKNINKKKIYDYVMCSEDELKNSFKAYRKRIFSKNSKFLLYFAKFLSPIKIFKNIAIYLDDIKKTVVLDLFSETLIFNNESPDLIMSSESLNFMLNNPFGFDTLTVNGCFEEYNKGGFAKATKSLALENLNNMGIMFNIKIFINYNVILLFLERLKNVEKNLDLKSI